MIQIVYGLVLLLLVLAVVVLFAMLGELASRVPASTEPDRTVWPFDQARLGAVPDYWPEPIADFVSQRGTETVELIILSSSCTSCKAVAAQLTALKREDPALDLAAFPVITCSTRERGEQFVATHGLQVVPHFIDEGGAWVSGNFDVTLSPCALLFDDGALTSALAFQDFTALQESVRTRAAEREYSWETLSSSGRTAEQLHGEVSSG